MKFLEVIVLYVMMTKISGSNIHHFDHYYFANYFMPHKERSALTVRSSYECQKLCFD